MKQKFTSTTNLHKVLIGILHINSKLILNPSKPEESTKCEWMSSFSPLGFNYFEFANNCAVLNPCEWKVEISGENFALKQT